QTERCVGEIERQHAFDVSHGVRELAIARQQGEALVFGGRRATRNREARSQQQPNPPRHRAPSLFDLHRQCILALNVIAASSAPAATPNREIGGGWLMWSLTSIAAAALVIRAYVGSLEFMDFDEWQQVFMASAPRWKDLAYELHAEAHPPAFYLLLKALTLFGHSKLLYRCIALVPGIGSVALIGIIARRLLRSSAMALLCAGALALSTAAITISIEVRQYQLAVFLVLVAFNAFLTMWAAEAPIRSRSYVIYAVSSALAVLCHYSAVVFLGACAVLAGARAMFDSKWRRQLDWRLAATLVSPLAL